MDIFEKLPNVIKSIEAKKVIRLYNKLATTLMEFEVVYHQAWKKQVRKTKLQTEKTKNQNPAHISVVSEFCHHRSRWKEESKKEKMGGGGGGWT